MAIPSGFPAVFFALMDASRAQAPRLLRTSTSRTGAPLQRAQRLRVEREFVAAIQDSVRRTFRTREDTYLSLSAGHDSCAILGALVALQLDAQTFTYGLTDPPRWSDVAIAREIARRLDYPHEIWPMDGYSVDVVQRENARRFCFRATRPSPSVRSPE